MTAGAGAVQPPSDEAQSWGKCRRVRIGRPNGGSLPGSVRRLPPGCGRRARPRRPRGRDQMAQVDRYCSGIQLGRRRFSSTTLEPPPWEHAVAWRDRTIPGPAPHSCSLRERPRRRADWDTGGGTRAVAEGFTVMMGGAIVRVAGANRLYRRGRFYPRGAQVGTSRGAGAGASARRSAVPCARTGGAPHPRWGRRPHPHPQNLSRLTVNLDHPT